MPKRKLPISSIPYSTNDGGRWLKKALDPADVDVDIIGMPDTATNSRTVLNYQMQADVPIPDPDTYIPTNVSSYDADLYLFQSPLIFGMSVSYPQGTRDPSTGPIHVDFSKLTLACSPGTAPRTVNVFVNDQIEGSTYSAKLDNFTNYCQRYRMIYGGVQAIPACSALFDSGTIEATQQIYNPENMNVSNCTKNNYKIFENLAANTETLPNYNAKVTNGKIYRKQKYNTNDFANSGIAIQNPTSLYCRYKEGTYMPYKIRNPLVHQYMNSEERAVVETPFVMTNTAIYSYTIDMDPDVINGQDFGSSGLHHGCWSGPMDYDPSNRVFKPVDTSTPVDNIFKYANNISICVKCFSKTGIAFWLRFSLDLWNQYDSSRNCFYQIVGPNDVNIDFNLPEVIPAYNQVDPVIKQLVAEGANDRGSVYANCEVLNGTIENVYTAPENPLLLLPSGDSNIGVINFKSIGVQASIRLIFRIGIEMLITAGGVYSPFKHKAPKYDEKAINSYVRAVHNMRDAFLGNAATAEGHYDYALNVSNIVSSLANPGSGWYGRVSI